MSQRDEKYRAFKGPVADFDFDEDTARVFDDMLDRSVPRYQEIQRMLGTLAAAFSMPQSRLYDLGCSTGNSLIAFDQQVPQGVTLIGIDASSAMLARARQKLEALSLRHPFDLLAADLESEFPLEQASVVVLNLTLQFVRPIHRERLLARIFKGTLPGGCLLLVEKVLCSDSRINRLYIDQHYAFKRENGYSEMEIAKKREALENVLVPYQHSENCALLKAAGYTTVETFFRWYNFEGLIAVRAAN